MRKLCSFLKEMSKFIVGYVKSMLFAGLYLAIVRRSICLMTSMSQYEGSKDITMKIMQHLLDLWVESHFYLNHHRDSAKLPFIAWTKVWKLAITGCRDEAWLDNTHTAKCCCSVWPWPSFATTINMNKMTWKEQISRSWRSFCKTYDCCNIEKYRIKRIFT